MAERKKGGLCYNCDDKYTWDHNCKQLYLLEIIHPKPGDEETSGEDPEPKTSLHVLTGIKSGCTSQPWWTQDRHTTS